MRKTAPRRQFLKTAVACSSALAVAPTIVRSSALAQGPAAPNNRINLGVVGIGPRCRYDLSSILKFEDVRVVALAEVQRERRESGKQYIDDAYGNKDLQVYRDFREILARDDIDAVLIATGDRWHAAASILAAEAGKDVYSEKPCGITIADCQRLADTMHREKRVFQAGTQRRSVANFQQVVDFAHSGKLGQLKELHASVYIPTLDNSWLPAEPLPSAEECDWNMWLGPAAWRPYNKKYVDGQWRGQWDFDSGARLLDWGAHTVDLCQWANRSDDALPTRFEPFADKIVGAYANGVKLVIDFLPEPFGNRDPHYITRLGTCPVRFIGEDGWVETGDEGEIVASSPALQKELPDPSKRVKGLDVSTHARNFFDCARSRAMTNANQDVMRRSHIACHAAALAWVLNRPLEIDATTEKFVNDEVANGLQSRAARSWS